MATSPGSRPSRVSTADSRLAALERRLVTRYQVGGEASARAALVERYVPLAYQLARHYSGADKPVEDLMQVAVVGLVKAIDRFDLTRRMTFSTYALTTIQSEIQRELHGSIWTARVSQDMQELALRIEGAIADLQRRLGRAPTVEEVARECSGPGEVISLDAARARRRRRAAAAPGLEEQEYQLIEHMLTLEPVIKALSERQRVVLKQKFVDEFSRGEIAENLGVSELHVARLLQRSVERLQVVAEAG